jgi:CRISPR system Cascade subunit CasB
LNTPESISTDAGSASNLFGSLAAHIARAQPGERAALARLEPGMLKAHQVSALARALMAAGLNPETWKPTSWPRWALIAHGIALAGHDGSQRLGAQLAGAGVSEARVTRLLTSRGDAFTQMLPSFLRLLASKGVSPNWRELGNLILTQEHDDSERRAQAEDIRLGIAGAYFSEVARSDKR